jgi:tRNA modification GTPase
VSLEIVELTPRGSGAVSVLRVGGADAARWVRDLCGGADIAADAPRCVRLRLGEEALDEALACVLPSGAIELHVHGSPTLVRRLVECGVAPDAARRSVEVEAAEKLAHAACEAAARILLDQAEGALARELRALSGAASPEDDRRIDLLLARWTVARRALEPAEVVIAGEVNAGKSTLFNALLGEGRALVSAEPGTTRDRLRARAQLGAWPAWISDTAGEREPTSDVEREGRERARRARASADLVLWLEPSAREAPEPDARTVVVHTFADRQPIASRARGTISALRDPVGARAQIAERFRAAFALPPDPWEPGAGVPVTSEQARAVAALRGLAGSALRRAVEALLEGSDVARAQREP